MENRTVLWWGRFDPGYSRNRVLRGLLGDLGWRIRDFRPLLSRFAGTEASLRRIATPDLVWVPCFRQRDAAAAIVWARARGAPILFDPLISAWDKQVFERGKFTEDSAGARDLLAWEQGLFRQMDMVVADTPPHAEFFAQRFGLDMDRLAVIPVGAEESLFEPAPPDRAHQGPVEVLFYGSFIGLQGPETIIEAAKLYDGPPVSWHLLGAGPLLADCQAAAQGLENVVFEPWIDYKRLPARIQDADILLGVFGASEKAGRVIPNKVYQALACGRPVITRRSDAYPPDLDRPDSGIAFIPPGDAGALAETVSDWVSARDSLPDLSASAIASYGCHFGNTAVRGQLRDALARLGFRD
jgi:glycosyltransferase involved in cell wall biosynthesis